MKTYKHANNKSHILMEMNVLHANHQNILIISRMNVKFVNKSLYLIFLLKNAF